MTKFLLTSGGILAMLGVLFGAFGAHALEQRVSAELLEIFNTATRYHFYHAIGLLILGISSYFLPDTGWLRWSGYLMLTGVIIFSGSLYLLVLTDTRWLGAITPIGGTALIISWGLFVVAVLQNSNW
jgi:uncharacterized membrane protein YgdD (TMEM256/DUF423 family)